MQFRIMIILAIATTSGCHDSGLEPFDTTIAGRFVLETVKGNALPAVTTEGEVLRVTVLVDTFQFPEPGLARHTAAYRVLNKTTGQTTTTAVEYGQAYRILSYDRRGAVIEFICDDTAICIGPSVARISRSGTMTTGSIYEQTHRYRRLQ